MQIFVINLDSAKERLVAVDAQLKRLGVTYTRIAAVNGRALSLDKKRKVVNRFRWWCAVGRPPTDGEIGCALSHASVYRKMLDENIPFACVIEDDVVLDDRFPQVLAELETYLIPQNSSVWLLSNHSDPGGQMGNPHSGFKTPVSDIEFRFRETLGDFCAECYVLTMESARQLLRVNSPLIVPSDWWGRWRSIHAIKLFHVFPTVASQNKSGFSSTTNLNSHSVNELPWYLLLFHKFKRFIGLVFDFAMTGFTKK